jgi:hypothetical protein
VWPSRPTSQSAKGSSELQAALKACGATTTPTEVPVVTAQWPAHPLLAVAVGQRVPSGRVKKILGMAQNFIACDRGQSMLLPPDLTDWVPDDHVVWSILGAVDQMDLGAFYGAYRANGQGRAAYEPSMMAWSR